MPDRILLLTDCGEATGFGHLTRCLSLAHAFRVAGFPAEVWAAPDDATAMRLPEGARAIDWRGGSGEVSSELRRTHAVLIDSLVATAAQIDGIRRINSQCAIIDDWIRRPHERGIVIDWTIGAEKFAYRRKFPGVCYLLGSRYCALRPEFSSASPRSFSGPPRSVLVTFGGSDIRALTGSVCAMLEDEFSELYQHVIVGPGVPLKVVGKRTREDRTAVHVACNAAQMREVMAQADLAICAGGQTMYELASQGLPPAVIGVIDNQQDDIREFTATGFALSIGTWNTPDLLSRIAAGLRTLWPSSERQGRSAIGRREVDGRGAERVVAACLRHWSGKAVDA